MATISRHQTDHIDLHLSDDEPPFSFDDLGAIISVDGKTAIIVSLEATFRTAGIAYCGNPRPDGCREITVAHRTD